MIFALLVLANYLKAQMIAESQSPAENTAMYCSWEDDSLTVTMKPGLQPFEVNTSPGSDLYQLSVDDTLVYDNVTSLTVVNGYTVRGFYASHCSLQFEDPDIALEVIGYEGEVITADLEQMAVPQSSLPDKYEDYSCFTWLYRGNQKAMLLESKITEGVILFQLERWDLTLDILFGFILVGAFILFRIYKDLLRFGRWISKSEWAENNPLIAEEIRGISSNPRVTINEKSAV